MTAPPSRWHTERVDDRGESYDTKWEQLAAAGASVHGEADFVCRFTPRRVLDAGCGTGRVAIELARRGIEVVGADLDPTMLDVARRKAPELDWVEGSVHDIDLGSAFDLVVTAGNVMIYVQPGTEAAVVANLARHVAVDGHLVSGFQLGQGYELRRYDADCAAAGLTLAARYSTWDAAPWPDDADYAVSVHRRSEQAPS